MIFSQYRLGHSEPFNAILATSGNTLFDGVTLQWCLCITVADVEGEGEAKVELVRRVTLVATGQTLGVIVALVNSSWLGL